MNTLVSLGAIASFSVRAHILPHTCVKLMERCRNQGAEEA
jgi:dihydrodipicolinate synthase/N-acetylneuraminate lyase